MATDAVIKEEPMETPDELPAIEVQCEAPREDLVDRISDINTDLEDPPEINFPTDENTLPDHNIPGAFCMYKL